MVLLILQFIYVIWVLMSFEHDQFRLIIIVYGKILIFRFQIYAISNILCRHIPVVQACHLLKIKMSTYVNPTIHK